MKANGRKCGLIGVLLLALMGFTDSSTEMLRGIVYNQADNSPLKGVQVRIEGTAEKTVTDDKGRFTLKTGEGAHVLIQAVGFKAQRIKIPKSLQEKHPLEVWLQPETTLLDEVVVVGYGSQPKRELAGAVKAVTAAEAGQRIHIRGMNTMYEPQNTESYKGISENGFLNPLKQPLSTFAIDVDAASYSNVRRFINNGQLPPRDAVRVEEMVNYFRYDLAGPRGDDPVAIHTELSVAPWNPVHQLLRIGLKAKSVPTEKLPPSNLVFLIDISGSMMGSNRLPLAQSSMKMLVDQLRDNDQVAIVTYAGTAGIKLPGTPGSQKTKIKDAIDGLQAGGSTAGGAGLKLAYQLAREHFIKGGNNRIILASDGDFNVGASSDADMEQLVTQQRESGISLSVLGFGMGNLKDSKMETLANKGHGNYAYIDNITEARKAMVTEFGATLFTVAKDVKMQVEFNPARVQAYRLVGYENRLLEAEDFNNDRKLGGDMGVGHTVTALYEIVPVGAKSDFAGSVDPLKYQRVKERPAASAGDELATVKFRYKQPDGDKSRMQQVVVTGKPVSLPQASGDLRFASAVAELGMLLRNSDYKQQSGYENLISRAKAAKGEDEEGYRAEFIRLAESAKLLARTAGVSAGR